MIAITIWWIEKTENNEIILSKVTFFIIIWLYYCSIQRLNSVPPNAMTKCHPIQITDPNSQEIQAFYYKTIVHLYYIIIGLY